MKKLLMGSIVLTLFAVSTLLFQMSCKKDATAQTGGTTGLTQINKIIYAVRDPAGVSFAIWVANYDGSSKTKINVALPTGLRIYPSYSNPFQLKLSPDGKTVFFSGLITGEQYGDIYSCNIDGSNVTKIPGTKAEVGSAEFFLGDAR